MNPTESVRDRVQALYESRFAAQVDPNQESALDPTFQSAEGSPSHGTIRTRSEFEGDEELENSRGTKNLSTDSDNEVEAFMKVRQNANPIEGLYRLLVVNLECRDKLDKLIHEKDAKYRVPETLKESVKDYTKLTILSPSLTAYRSSRLPSNVVQTMRQLGIQDLPKAQETGRCSAVESMVIKAATEARYKLKSEVISSLTSKINIATLVNKCIQGSRAKVTLPLYMQIAWLRKTAKETRINPETPEKEGKLAKDDAWWVDIDKKLAEMRTEYPESAMQQLFFEVVLSDDWKEYPACAEAKANTNAVSMSELEDWLVTLKKHGYTLGQSLPGLTAPLQTAVDLNIDPTLANPLSSSIPPPTISFPHHTTPTTAPATAPPQATSGQAVWTADAEALLINFLIDAKGQGLMSENNFNKVYAHASRHLHENGYNFSKSQVKSYWTRFKAQFKIVVKLCTLSGFGWDAACCMVIATDPCHKKAQLFHKNPFPHYDEIADMIGHSTAIGAFSLSSENSASNLQKAKPNASSEESSDDDNSSSSDSDDDDVNLKTPAKKRHPSVSTPAPRKHVCISAGAQALKTMLSSVAALTEGLKSGSFMAPSLTDSPASKKRAFVLYMPRKVSHLTPFPKHAVKLHVSILASTLQMRVRGQLNITGRLMRWKAFE
ncbi:hypothetical protein D9758_016605 [Tetrapyrgos nigripes]|uniref:Myb/SANT-like domain-containing protein n=1 Tax=Tetrapyrgos nigripes TaxID=182062 RepID=A0A8H5CFG5_9AGAR|nr:hypothetical protein D9758_016605 [Tetrapyrgos nigripes]